ncbi:MAG TPA: VIT domain-containing protein [Pirellulales bacterium]|jgi:Ca-activated chloride channel family protein|nr:VIT domain-containing protein [Pirellulales bacterium]
MFRSIRFAAALLLAALCVPQFTAAQGVLVNVNVDQRIALPRPDFIIIHPPHPIPLPHPIPPSPPPSTYKIKELSVHAKLSGQVAKVQVTQSFVNTGSQTMEVCFVFPLPYDGAVDQLTLLVDGKEFAAKLLDAKDARKMYEEIVRKNRDPALLEWVGSGLFKTSVFPVPAGAERKVTLKYTQLCRQLDGATDFLFPLSTAKYTSQPVEKISFDIAIESENDIKNIYSPTHSIDIKRPDDKHANVSYSSKDEIPSSDFRLFYDVGKGHVGTTVLSYRPDDHQDGYYLLLASPEIKSDKAEHQRKTVLFVLDRSGSMAGPKIDQAKAAVKFVLNNLHEGDLFNIVAFDSEIESFKPELQKFNEQTRKEALGFASGIYAGGGTNIDGALKLAFSLLKDKKQPTYVLFMTDGIPTVGETTEAKIVANAKKYNEVRARLFSFGVGYDLNARLLDKLVREMSGLSEFVRPNEDIEARVSALYNRIGSPVMTDLNLKFEVDGLKAEDGAPVNRSYPKEVRDLFAGEQLVIVGRYKKPGDAKVVLTGSVDGKEQKLDFPAKLIDKSKDDSFSFIEKLWAMRRVGEILDEIDLKGKNEELVKELVTLATKHGILTPYTSFMADDHTNVHDLTMNIDRAGVNLDSLQKESEGRGAVAQRAAKSAFQNAGRAGGNSNFNAALEATRTEAAQQAQSNAGGAAVGGFKGAPAAVPLILPAAPGQINAPAASGSPLYVDDQDKVVVVNNVKQIGRKAFYYRNNRWVDSAVSEAQEKKPIEIKRFSPEYFELVDKYGKDVTKYMTIDEPVTVELGGQAYAF